MVSNSLSHHPHIFLAVEACLAEQPGGVSQKPPVLSLSFRFLVCNVEPGEVNIRFRGWIRLCLGY